MAEVDVFQNEHFVDELLAFLVSDRNFLKVASHMVTSKDFRKANQQEGMERQIVADLALDFWRRYREPLGKMLTVELQEYCRQRTLSPATQKRILDYGAHLTTNGHGKIAPDLILGKVQKYRVERQLSQTMDQMLGLMQHGKLGTEEFLRLAREAVKAVEYSADRPVDIFSEKEMERRILRRQLQQQNRTRYPVLLIDPIDRMIRIIARKHMGLILAPYKRGKTMLFIWIALAYALQGLNVLHFTLEDPREDIEDRYDAAISNLPIARLGELSDKMRERFLRYKRLVRSKIKVVDGTDGHMSVARMESTWEQERNQGFVADASMVDYDDEVEPAKKDPERRMEFAGIYRDYRAYLARTEQLGWIASQTTRSSEDMKIIGGKHTAEDISKIRKASMAISLGKGDWGPNSRFLWVPAHRYDKMNLGANIMTDPDRSIFFDRDKTLEKEKEERLKKETV